MAYAKAGRSLKENILKEALEKGQIANDFWNTEFGTNQRSADEIGVVWRTGFDFAKPERLLMNIISLISGKGDLILISFSGREQLLL